MNLYADVLDLLARLIWTTLIATAVVAALGALVALFAGSDSLPYIAVVVGLTPLVAVAVTLRAEAGVVREQLRRARVNAAR